MLLLCLLAFNAYLDKLLALPGSILGAAQMAKFRPSSQLLRVKEKCEELAPSQSPAMLFSLIDS